MRALERGGITEERRPASEQLEQHAAERIQIAALVDRGRIRELLRRHVLERAVLDAGARRIARISRELACEPEVEDVDTAVGRRHEVVGLEIAMLVPCGVELRERA